MGISLEQYRACIGIFNSSKFCKLSHILYVSCSVLGIFLFFRGLFLRLISGSCTYRSGLLTLNFLFQIFSFLLLLLSGDIEVNPGPKRLNLKDLSICHWNLNSIMADEYSKVSEISAFLDSHRFDIFCISESFLDSSIDDEDLELEISGYDFIRCDHPSNTKRGGVMLYYKDHLPIIERSDLTQLEECLVCELKDGQNHLLICLCYRSPSQEADEFDFFKLNWERTIQNISNCSPTFSIFIGDFNARNSEWWVDDITNNCGRDISDIALRQGLTQIIDQPTHIRLNSRSCIDLIFTSNEHLVTSSGVLPSLYSTCHHQVIFSNFNFKVPSPPSYQRRIWDFSRADKHAIKRAMNLINWDIIFLGLSVDQMVSTLTECILNIFSNFVPNKLITIRHKDGPWMTPEIKGIILEKAKVYKLTKNNPDNAVLGRRLQELQSSCKRAIKTAKGNYRTKLGSILDAPNTGPKKYWSVLKRIIHKRKVARIPPIRSANNSLITDVSQKADIFNIFFSEQCSLIQNDSVLPQANQPVVDTRLDSIDFDPAKLLAFIRALDSNKAHGWDGISVRMIKICEETLLTPLMTIFRLSLASGVFPNHWKKGNIVPIHKKGDKSIVKNYRPVSLLPILSKLFEKCIYDTLYSYFESHNLFSECQSGFRKGDSCVSQLLSITHNIFKGFDASPSSLDTRGVFLDISKAFDRVWHDGLIFKLKCYGVNGPLLSLLRSFLSGRVQRVLLDGKNSSWKPIRAGVPQGSILGPLFFLIYINDLPLGIESLAKIFADDTSLFSLVLDQIQSCSMLNRDLERINEWAYHWKMSFNPDPTKQAVGIYFSKRGPPENSPNITFNNAPVNISDSHKHLGMILDSKLTFDLHLQEKSNKANKGIGIINKVRNFVSRESLLTIYKAFVRPHLDYGDIIYDRPGNATFSEKLESIQYNACLAITGCIRGTSREKMYNELGMESLEDRRYSRRLFFFYKIVKGTAPKYLTGVLPVNRNVRQRLPIYPLRFRTESYRRSFFPFCIGEWNKLDSHIRDLPLLQSFKKAIFNFIRPSPASTFHVNHKGLKLLNRLRVGFSHLREHKFRHGFQDTLDPICLCRTNSIETTSHYLLQCSNFSNERLVLFDGLRNLNISFLPRNPQSLARFLLFGDSSLKGEVNRNILILVIDFLINTNRFRGPLFD